MRLPQISDEHDTELDALQNKTPKIAAIKRLGEILPQKARRCQRLARFSALSTRIDRSYCRPKRP
jgi:hypothetical protein